MNKTLVALLCSLSLMSIQQVCALENVKESCTVHPSRNGGPLPGCSPNVVCPFGITGPQFAFDPPMLPGPPPFVALLFNGLELTPDQMESIYKEQSAFTESIAPLMMRGRGHAQSFFDSLINEDSNVEQAKNAQAQMDNTRHEFAELLTAHIARTMRILTPEQKRKMRQNFLKLQLQGMLGPSKS